MSRRRWRRCPHEDRQVIEGTFTAAVSYRFTCTCPDRETFPCQETFCLCPVRPKDPTNGDDPQ